MRFLNHAVWLGALLVNVSVQTAFAQCADSTTALYWNNYTIRETDNTVYSYAVTGPLSGNYAALWQPFVSTWLYKDGNQLDFHQRDSALAGQGQYVSRWYRRTLQSDGPGQYHLHSYHEAYAAECNQWAPPYQSGWNGIADSYKTVARPTITRSVIPYWLGGPTSANDYSSQTTMSIAGRNEATSTPTYYFAAGSSFGSLSCSNCTTSTLTVTRGPTGCAAYNIVLKASFGGFDSDPFWIDIQTPNLLSFARTDEDSPGQGGWESHVVYEIFDGCNLRMSNVTANEVFTSWQQLNGSNWPAPLEAAYWGGMYYDPITSGWTLVDVLYEIPAGGKSPPPYNDGTNGFDESQASLMTQHTQVFRVGATYNGAPTGNPPNPSGPTQGDDGTAQGVLVQTNAHYHYLDHGNHGRRF